MDWNQIEKDFIEWDNSTHSNASQRQILDWFKERFKIESEIKPKSTIESPDFFEQKIEDEFDPEQIL